MKITQVLFKFHPLFIGPIPKFKGSATKGKHKWVPPATKATRYLLWQQWKDEEEVLKYVSKPFISVNEELDYLESIGEKHQDVDPLYTSLIETPMRQRYATDILDKFDRTRKYEILD